VKVENHEFTDFAEGVNVSICSEFVQLSGFAVIINKFCILC